MWYLWFFIHAEFIWNQLGGNPQEEHYVGKQAKFLHMLLPNCFRAEMLGDHIPTDYLVE